MRRFFLMCLLPIFLATGVFAQPQADEYPYDLTYFLPEGSQVMTLRFLPRKKSWDSSLENNMPDGIK